MILGATVNETNENTINTYCLTSTKKMFKYAVTDV